MRFGRVEEVVTPVDVDGRALLHLVVWLETGRWVETVRDETLPPLRAVECYAELVWHAGQWTREMIGATLTERGWEAVGAGKLPDPDAPPEPGALPRSAPHAVRNLAWE